MKVLMALHGGLLSWSPCLVLVLWWFSRPERLQKRVPRSTLLRWSGADTPVALLEVPELQCVGLPRDESQLELARTALDAISPGRVSRVIWGYGNDSLVSAQCC